MTTFYSMRSSSMLSYVNILRNDEYLTHWASHSLSFIRTNCIDVLEEATVDDVTTGDFFFVLSKDTTTCSQGVELLTQEFMDNTSID